MAIAYVASSTDAAASGTPYSIPLPSGITAGQHAYIFLDVQATDSTVNIPTGFDLYDTQLTSGDKHLFMHKTIASGDSGLTYTAAIAGAGGGSTIRRMVQVIVVSGCDPTPLDWDFAAHSGAAATTHPIPTVASSIANWGALYHVSERIAVASTDFTWPTQTPTITERQKQTQTGSSQFAAESATQIGTTTAGSVGGGNVTGTVATSNTGVWTVVLSPAGTPPQTYDNGRLFCKSGGVWQ